MLSVSTYPLDLVRSRLSIATATIGSSGAATLAGQKLGIWSMTVKVFREEGGMRGLYRGLTPTAMGVAPCLLLLQCSDGNTNVALTDVGLNFAGYEFLRGFLLPPEGEPTVLRKLGCVRYSIQVFGSS